MKHLWPKLVWGVAFIFVILFLFGCSSKDSKLVAKAAEINAFNQEEDKLFVDYMTGNVEQARQSLKKLIQHTEESNVLNSNSRTGSLTLNYDRLYVLDTRSGDKASAEVALIKARYWYITGLELNGFSNSEVMDTIKLDTPEKIEKRVDDFDKGANNGKLPKYVQYITNSPSEENAK